MKIQPYRKIQFIYDSIDILKTRVHINDHLQKLLENQQVLTLQAQEKIKLLSSENQQTESDEPKQKPKWQFWQ